MLGMITAPIDQRKLTAKALPVCEHLRCARKLKALHHVEGADHALVARAAVDQDRLGQITTRLAESVMVAKKRLQFLSLAGVNPKPRDERKLLRLIELMHVARPEHLDEKGIFRIGVADTHPLRRRIDNVNDTADALADDEIRTVKLQVDPDFRRLGKKRGRQDERREATDNHAVHKQPFISRLPIRHRPVRRPSEAWLATLHA